jgi:ABC-type multidrug transport system fused ATPase/permease subunit
MKNPLRRIARFVWPYRWTAFVLFFTVIFPVAMELVVPRALQFMIDGGIRAGDMSAIAWGASIMLGAVLIGALVVSPAILILDDSTSSVDVETEVRIQDALETLMAGCTTFVVAQRISSVLTADQILVLDDGHIAAQGTHRELLDSSPIYQEIYHSQLGKD